MIAWDLLSDDEIIMVASERGGEPVSKYARRRLVLMSERISGQIEIIQRQLHREQEKLDLVTRLVESR